MRVIYVDPALARLAGHPFHMAIGFRDELARRGIAVELLAHSNASPEIIAAIGARATIGRSSYEQALDDELAGPLEEFLDTAEACSQGLARSGIVVDRDDIVLLPCAMHGETYGLARWLAGLGPGSRPRLALNFISDWFLNHGDGGYGVRARCYRFAARKLWAVAERGRVTLCANTPAMTRHLSFLLDAPVALYPAPMWYPPGPGDDHRSAARGIVVAVIGPSRTEKGSPLVPDILRAAAALDARLSFRVQLGAGMKATERAAWLARIAEIPRVQVHAGALSSEEYFRELATADLVLLPYDPRPYAVRTSGVFAEAVAFARPSVVPAKTWMAEQIATDLAAGVTFEGNAPQSIAAAVAEAARRLPELRAQAQSCAEPWRRSQSVTAFVDRLLLDLAS